ncbi:MAG: transcription termination/antitermination protein NusG [Anaerolineales bacterium]|nr:transcription termination/antitermination protein NusG [Anaerolineales bacterium]
MEEHLKKDENPQNEPETEEVVSGEDKILEDTSIESETSVDEVNEASENADENLAEKESAEAESEDAVDEPAEDHLIPEEGDKSEDESSVENDVVAVDETPEDLESDAPEPAEAERELEAAEESEAEPSPEKQEDELEIADDHEQPTETVEAAVEKEKEAEIDRDWFVIHCYSGYENKVRYNLEQRIETMDMKNKIFDVVVPTEEEIEVKDGKRRTVERRVFPGYILVQMILDEDSWYVVRNTPGVTGFVGMGNEPTPLRPEEVAKIVKRMEADAPRIKLAYSIGQKVRIIDGPFNDFIGTVADIDMERAMVRVMVSFFGRETPVELDFLQVDKA